MEACAAGAENVTAKNDIFPALLSPMRGLEPGQETNAGMSHRYKIRTFESEQDGALEAGTIVMPLEKSFSIFARTVDEAERQLKQELAEEKLVRERVYQVCPPFGNPESIRAFAVTAAGECQRVFLDPATGVYSEFRRIRHQDLRVNAQREMISELQKA
jgi:hypothetical protein